ncbi:retrovirus-related pol polyprotein from transposon TNT 1-94 [Tanacetum coccineum]
MRSLTDDQLDIWRIDSELASLFSKLKYEENLIDSIYETKKSKSLVSATPLSTAFILTSIVQDFQDSLDDEEDIRSSQEYLNDLEEEYQARALLAKSKRFFKKGTQRFSSTKATDQTEYHKCGKKGHFAKDCWSKVSVPSYQSPFEPKLLTSKAATVKNKGLIDEAYEWDEEEVSSDDNEIVEVKVLMSLAEENDAISKEGARNGEWVKIFMRKLLVLKHAKLNFLTMQHVNTEIFKENKNLRTEPKELKAITETWLNSSNKVNQCIGEQIPSQKKRILGVDQLTKDPSSSRILPAESQRNTTDSSVAVTNFSATDYDSTDESSVYSTPLPPLKKLGGAELIFGPKTIKSILRIISLEREINQRNPQHAFKRCEACGSSTHSTTDHYDIEWFKRGEALQAK